MSDLSATRPRTTPEQPENQHRFMVFDLDARGHHPGYIQHLVSYWCQHDLPGHLDVLVSQAFMQQHTDIINLANGCSTIRFVSISKAEQAELFSSEDLGNSFRGRIVRAFQEWRLLRKYAKSLGTTHAVVMYLDKMLLRLALGAAFPCSISAVYFRPLLHYAVFPNYNPEGKEGIWRWRDRLCLARFLPSSSLKTLFCLDPFAVEYINQVYDTTKAVHLVDPVQRYSHKAEDCEQLRTQLGIEPGRSVFLLFGALENEHKGLDQVLEAIAQVPPALCRRMTLLLAGTMTPKSQQELAPRLAQLTETHSIQIVTHYKFIPDQSIYPYFHSADVVLVPYQRHIGMSAILVRAAAAQKPVLASDFGVMGELTRRYQLGITVDSTVPEEIAKGMMRYLLEIPSEMCDSAQQKWFADRNTAEQFASQIFQSLSDTETRGSRKLPPQSSSSYQPLSNSNRT